MILQKEYLDNKENREYLLSFLNEHMKPSYLAPFVVGVIWCLWHYYYLILF